MLYEFSLIWTINHKMHWVTRRYKVLWTIKKRYTSWSCLQETSAPGLTDVNPMCNVNPQMLRAAHGIQVNSIQVLLLSSVMCWLKKKQNKTEKPWLISFAHCHGTDTPLPRPVSSYQWLLHTIRLASGQAKFFQPWTTGISHPLAILIKIRIHDSNKVRFLPRANSPFQ